MALMWQVIQRLSSIVDFWGERQVYSMASVAELRQTLSGPSAAPPMQVRAASYSFLSHTCRHAL